MAHTIDVDRLQRAKSERMFLVGCVNQQDKFSYRVMGSTSNIYDVDQSREIGFFHCSCPDYSRRFLPCKHMAFIIFRCLNAQQPQSHGNRITFPSTESLYQLALTRNERLLIKPTSVRAVASTGNIVTVNQKPFKNTDECPICFEEFGAEETSWCQRQCGENFHTTCLLKFFQNRRDSEWRCPYCRASFGM